MSEPYETVTIPVPQLAPFGEPINNPDVVQEVWDTFVKPSQDAGELQSIEMRALMAILRAVHKGLQDAQAAS
jgi:hypothetical protein